MRKGCVGRVCAQADGGWRGWSPSAVGSSLLPRDGDRTLCDADGLCGSVDSGRKSMYIVIVLSGGDIRALRAV